jgi:hypothetical protein
MIPQTQYYRNLVYAPIREVVARMDFTLDGVTTSYDNLKIMSVNIVEEMDAVNETLPSNELKITMDNSAGDFNILTYGRMQEIIASRPKLKVDLGIPFYKADAKTQIENLKFKVAGNTVNNPHRAFIRWVFDPITDDTPTAITTEYSQGNYDQITEQDWWSFNYSATSNLVRAANMFSFDILRALEDEYGIIIWQGKTAIADKIALAKTYIKTLSCDYWGYGTSPNGTKVSCHSWNAVTGAWGTAKTHALASVQKLNHTFSAIPTDNVIDANGKMHFLCYAEKSNGTTASNLFTDYIQLSIEVNAMNLIEWIPMGVYNLIEWKNETAGGKAISMYGRDNFDILSQIAFDDLTTKTLYDMAIAVLAKANITNYSIDTTLQTMSARFFETLDCRSALQYIGIASRSAVLQDRYGKVIIKPFAVMDVSSNYLRYSGQPNLISGTQFAYPLVTTGAGMKYLDFDNMYTVPEITLDKSIYQVIVKAYLDPNDPDVTFTHTYTSPNGQNGQSFSIDNPMITTEQQAVDVADWFWQEANYNARYVANWRQNPVLECADVILMEDDFNAKKQTRIIRQEFIYDGHLEGITESRGGF